MRNGSENQIRLVMVRHGATRTNKEHRYLGKTEEVLCEEAKAGLRAARAAGLYPEVNCLFSSPMKRCLETAEILYPDREPIVIPEWEEIDFGVFEGKNYMDLQGDVRYQAWIDSGGTTPFPEGESREEFMLRCEKGFEKMLGRLEQEGVKMKTEGRAQTSEAGKTSGSGDFTVGMIVHGGTIMSVLSRFYGGEYFDYQVSNGAGYVCVLKRGCGEPKITECRKMEFGETKLAEAKSG